MPRQVASGTWLIAAGLLAFIGISLWATGRMVAAIDTQTNTLKAVIQTNRQDIAWREYEANLLERQADLAAQQLALLQTQFKAAAAPHKAPSQSPPPVANVVISTSSSSTWPADYGALLSGFGAFVAALVAVLVAWRHRKGQQAEDGPSRNASDDPGS